MRRRPVAPGDPTQSRRDSAARGVRLSGHAAAGGQPSRPRDRRPSARARCSMRRFSERAIDRPQGPSRGESLEGLGSQPTRRSVLGAPMRSTPGGESAAPRLHAAPPPSRSKAFVFVRTSTSPGCERRLPRFMRSLRESPRRVPLDGSGRACPCPPPQPSDSWRTQALGNSPHRGSLQPAERRQSATRDRLPTAS